MAKKRKKSAGPVVKIPSPEEIKSIRERLGLTRAQAASRVGISHRTWMYYELGSQQPSAPVAILIRLLASEKI